MIVDAIFGVMRAVLSAVVALLPTASIPDLSAQVPALAPLWNGFAWANQYVPVDAVGIMLGLLVGTWAALQLVSGTVWLLSKLHVLGGSSQ